ncbi:MAG TPA: hypothetical protein VGM18_14430 [Candidatus Sulfotelmatobacter sp.]|jgi:hypothetical protein
MSKFRGGQACLQCSYVNIVTDNSATTNYQSVGVYLTGDTINVRVDSASICSYSSCGPAQISDFGSNNTITGYNKSVETASTNFGTAIASTQLYTVWPNANAGIVLELALFQMTAGVGCGAGSNTATLTYSFSDPTGTVHSAIAGPTLTISANGSLGSFASSTVSLPVHGASVVSWSASSTLASAGCSADPQYQAIIKVLN